MADFNQARDALNAARSASAEAQDAAAAARERLARIDAAIASLDRVRGGHDDAIARRRRELEQQRKQADAALAEAQAVKQHTAAAALDANAAFASFTDPRETLRLLDDSIPLLMLPVRLETRFGPIAGEGANAQRELWVRIYPDDCSIDTFEPTLTDTEVTNAQRYWAAVWQAGGVDAGERAAWRGLVASHGSGRAELIIGQYQPRNAKPAKTSPDDVILVVRMIDGALTAAEQAALATFWPAMWRAARNRAVEETARTTLFAAVGAARASELEKNFRPVNLGETPRLPLGRDQVRVSLAFVVLPSPDAVPTKRTGWSRAPFATLLPDRFVFIGRSAGMDPVIAIGAPVPSPLAAGPDPYAPPAEQLRPDGDGLFVPESMRWMVDFDEAVRVGMGLRIPLSGPRALTGFDRVLVVGVRLSAEPTVAKTELESLLEHHRLGRSGMSVVPQGTPTNNVDSGPSGYSRVDDADQSFNAVIKGAGAFPNEPDPLDKRDGQWLAEYLGVDAGTFAKAQNAGGRDQADARAMNVALWPATLGYWMETMMQPVFSAAVVDATRDFFMRYVSGRGAIPAIRIGRQPYGILPATALSRAGWLAPERLEKLGLFARGAFLGGLLDVLRRMEADWAALASGVSAIGNPGDPHRTLLDVIGLHPGSVELYQRYAESVTHLYNELLFVRAGDLLDQVINAPLRSGAMPLLQRLGYAGTAPEILSRIFRAGHEQLKGPIVDERKPSEADPLAPATMDGRNYLRWLADAARTSLDALYQQQGFVDGTPPRALLYLMLRHALQLGYHDGSVRAHVTAGLLSEDTARLARRDSPFLHVQTASTNESRYALLFKTAPEITGSATTRVSDYLAAKIGLVASTTHLAEQLDALDRLANASTARLERAFLEHIDCCSYRLDAWLHGFVHLQLEVMRGLALRQPAPSQDIHLGAYAWLEDLRPDPGALTPVELGDDLAAIFRRPGYPPLMRDPANQGFIHAPSLNQAVTAAVLRNGFISDASPANRQTLAVNLTSERVRRALAFIEGMRGGQSLGALLGYQMERGLHDRHALAEVDQFIFKLRKAFPLTADRLASTKTQDDVPIEAIEARNVMDGLALVQHVQARGNAHYPFGKPLPPATTAQAAAIDAEVQRLLEAHDALADLALAESVQQALLGNAERAAGTADAFSRSNFPPEPDVIRTPGNGIGLAHRVGLQFEPGADPAVSPIAGIAMTPRAQAEPAVNRWLADRLPSLNAVGCLVSFRAAASGALTTREVTLHDLGLQPIDIVLLTPSDSAQAMIELDDRIVGFATATFGARPDAPVEIRYLEKDTAALTMFEVLPLLRTLRRLVTLSRPLRASDLALVNEATAEHDSGAFVDRQRVVLVNGALTNTRDAVATLQATIAGVLTGMPARRPDVIAAADDWVRDVFTVLAGAALAGVRQAGWGFAHDFRARTFRAVLDNVKAYVARWDARLADHDALFAAYDALPAATPDERRFELLQQAERRIATALTTPRPATPAALRALLPGRRVAFVARRDQLDGLQSTTRTSVSLLLADVSALLPLTDFDLEDLSLTAQEDEAIRFAEDAVRVLDVVVKELDRRLDIATQQIAAHDASGDAQVKVGALTDAAKALLGAEFTVVPEFSLTTDQANEIATAVATSSSGDLFKYLVDTADVDFPLDTWLYGVARVRDKIRMLEQVMHLSAALGRSEPELTALQLPAIADDRWLALQFPPDLPLGFDRLLYTAHFAAPIDTTARQCGLLLDEWNERIPAPDATTGIAFHHDRPNQEAPQAMLLVTPTDFRGGWLWDDLVDALDETLDRAKRRAVEPVHLDATAYAQLLPATVTVSTINQLTISAVLAVNNRLETLAAFAPAPGGD